MCTMGKVSRSLSAHCRRKRLTTHSMVTKVARKNSAHIDSGITHGPIGTPSFGSPSYICRMISSLRGAIHAGT